MCKTPVYGTVVPLLQHLYLLLLPLLLVGLALLLTLQPLHGDVSELVVEDLLCNGSSLLSSVVQRVAEKLEESSTTQKEPQGRYSLIHTLTKQFSPSCPPLHQLKVDQPQSI